MIPVRPSPFGAVGSNPNSGYSLRGEPAWKQHRVDSEEITAWMFLYDKVHLTDNFDFFLADADEFFFLKPTLKYKPMED